MNPNSAGYLCFLTASALIHRALWKKYRNIFLLCISWVFYFICTPKFFVLFAVSTCVNYILGVAIQQYQNRKKYILLLGLFINIGMLFLFKYVTFCSSIISAVLQNFHITVPTLPTFAQPLGMSFYTFAVIGYLIDVYFGTCPAERNFCDFSLFVGFFPAILAGPIARSTQLLPQIKNHEQTQITSADIKIGITRLLIGLAKKMLLADQLAILVNTVYAAPEKFDGSQILLAAIAYSLQIYCDFSAYSDMAVGAGRLFGFQLIDNFDAPYLASSIKEFWRRWHISLTSWFRDYLYFPLGGNRKGKYKTYMNILIVFAVSGLWHGAAMQFLIWGFVNGLYQVIGSILTPAGAKLREIFHISKQNPFLCCIKTVLTFLLATIAWVFFRADSVGQAWFLLTYMYSAWGGSFNVIDLGMSLPQLYITCIAVIVLFLWDLLGKRFQLLQRLTDTICVRYIVWTVLLLCIVCFGAYGMAYDAQEFVYFKF